MVRAVLILLLTITLLGCERKTARQTGDVARTPTREEIFLAIETRATRYRLEPGFVYTLVAAESNFDAHARNGEACGLLQLKPDAWRSVSAEPFAPAVWDWRKNLEVGIDHLADLRATLQRKKVFSYPLLLAAFHYGLGYVDERQFDLRKIPVPESPIYRELWAGNPAPVPLPSGNKKPAEESAGGK